MSNDEARILRAERLTPASSRAQPDLRCRGRNYQPAKKQGAIILATGGDNSNSAQGCFYEGIMVSGVTTDATDEAVQSNVIAVKYSNWAPPS